MREPRVMPVFSASDEGPLTETGPKRSTDSVRQRLAADTRAVHQRLHEHPWISRLASPTLTAAHYRTLLEAYRAFFEHVESARTTLELMNPLSLAAAIASLDADINALRGSRDPRAGAIELRLDDRPSLLGALYVLHGSGFGNRVLERQVRKTLPSAPRDYLAAGTSRALWLELERTLETLYDHPTDRSRMTRSANTTFDVFGDFVTRYCRSNDTAD